MIKKQVNAYDVIFNGEFTKHVLAKNIKEVADTYENLEKPITQITRVRTDLEYLQEEPDLEITTQVIPAPMETAGNKAYPTLFTAQKDTYAFFEAVEYTGHRFVGWFDNEAGTGTPLSTERIAKLKLTQNKIYAKFEVI